MTADFEPMVMQALGVIVLCCQVIHVHNSHVGMYKDIALDVNDMFKCQGFP